MAAQHQPDSRDAPDSIEAVRAPSRSTLINRTVALDIIPRLVRAHGQVPRRMPGREGHPGAVQSDEVALFTQLVMHADDRALNDCVRVLRELVVPTGAAACAARVTHRASGSETP